MAYWLVATCEYYNVFVTYRPREIRIDLTLLLSFFLKKKIKFRIINVRSQIYFEVFC